MDNEFTLTTETENEDLICENNGDLDWLKAVSDLIEKEDQSDSGKVISNSVVDILGDDDNKEKGAVFQTKIDCECQLLEALKNRRDGNE